MKIALLVALLHLSGDGFVVAPSPVAVAQPYVCPPAQFVVPQQAYAAQAVVVRQAVIAKQAVVVPHAVQAVAVPYAVQAFAVPHAVPAAVAAPVYQPFALPSRRGPLGLSLKLRLGR